MSSATSAVTYTSVYANSEPGRAFWGADDEEISEGGIPRFIVLGYDGLPMQPVAPPSPDYIPGPEDPQTPLVPQDKDEREPMFMQAHDPDYVPEPIYPKYIPLEDKHEFPADGKDEDDEEEHLAPADSAIVVPVDEPVFPLEGTEPVIPPPSTDITIGARITVRPQASISLPPEAEGRALLAALPSPPLPPSLYIPPPIDHKDDILESEQPPRKRLCLSTLGSRYEIGESSTARPIRGQGIDYGFVSMVDVTPP
ncbi:hypothetical protein Tco_0917264 [Tanacetum coccineum]